MHDGSCIRDLICDFVCTKIVVNSHIF